MNNKPEIKTHNWSVSGTLPSTDQRYPHHGQNICLGIQASSMEKAMEAARKAYPEIKFFAVHHRGEVHIITE